MDANEEMLKIIKQALAEKEEKAKEEKPVTLEAACFPKSGTLLININGGDEEARDALAVGLCLHNAHARGLSLKQYMKDLRKSVSEEERKEATMASEEDLKAAIPDRLKEIIKEEMYGKRHSG